MRIKRTMIIVVGIIGIIIGAFVVTNLRDKESLISKIQLATYPGESRNAFNSKGELKYSDLSLKLRKKVTKEQFELIRNYEDAQKCFNFAFEKVYPLPRDTYVIDQPILTGTIVINNEHYKVDNQITIGYDYFIKPVIIQWYIDIYPYS